MLLRKRSAGLIILLSIVCAGILLLSCGYNSLSGPSIVGNPSVSATIVDNEGEPVKRLPVILLPVDHNSVRDTNLNKFAQGVTDDNGNIHLVNVRFRSDSAFNLTSTDINYRYRLIKRIRSADTATPDKSIALSVIKLRTPGAIKVQVDSGSFKTGFVLTIPGTSIIETVTTPGAYVLSAPAGAYTVRYTSASPLINADKIISAVTVNGLDTTSISVNNFITTRTVTSVLLKDQIPDIRNVISNSDTIGPNRLDTLSIAIDSSQLQYSIINRDTTQFKDTILLGRSTKIQSDTFNFTHDTLVTIDTVKKNDSIFTVHNIMVYNKYVKVDSTFTIDTIMERRYGNYINYKRLMSTVLIRKLLLEFSCPVVQQSECLQSTYLDTLLSITENRTFDTTIQGDTIYFRDSTRTIQKSVILDTIKRGDTTIWKDTTIKTDSLRIDSPDVIIDTMVFVDSLRFVTIHINSKSETITDTLVFNSDTTFYMINYPDTIMIPVTYYDFHSNGSNPEFEPPQFPKGIRTGMVESKLNASGKPLASSNVMMNAYMKYWFCSWADSVQNRDSTAPQYNVQTGALVSTIKHTYDTSFKNVVIHDSLMFVKMSGSDMYQHNSSSFFPLDNRGLGNDANSHNYSFTMQMNMNVYIGNDTKDLIVNSDDDMWVFVNNTLAIDLGGIQTSSKGVCTLSKYMVNGEKRIYPVSLFLAERQSSESYLHIQISGLRPY